MKKYAVIETYKGEEKLVDEVYSLEDAEYWKRELTIKYADCNTSYDFREIE